MVSEVTMFMVHVMLWCPYDVFPNMGDFPIVVKKADFIFFENKFSRFLNRRICKNYPR